MMDFTNMRPSDALEKAHEAFPEIEWDWTTSQVQAYSEVGCACAVALLVLATAEDIPREWDFDRAVEQWKALGKMFPGIPPERPTRSCFESRDFRRSESISRVTRKAQSFTEAIQLLRDAGW